MLFTVMCFPVLVNIVLEMKYIHIENEFQIYSLAVCAGLAFILLLFLASIWAVIITHYKHKNHPLVLQRFGFILNHVNDGDKAGEKPTLHGSLIVPLMITKRMIAAVSFGLLVRHTVSPTVVMGML